MRSHPGLYVNIIGKARRLLIVRTHFDHKCALHELPSLLIRPQYSCNTLLGQRKKNSESAKKYLSVSWTYQQAIQENCIYIFGCICKIFVIPRNYFIFLLTAIPANTKHLYNTCTSSAQQLRRWSNIVQLLYKCFVFAYLYIV